MLAKLEKIKVHEKRFGQIAVEMGCITPDDIIRLLRIQVEEESSFAGFLRRLR